jgi:tetratricopeptide (TPR) repeat protein
MRLSEGEGESSGRPTGVKPGALTALLQEVAAAPEEREAEPSTLAPGTVVGRFEVLREVGRGGFGVVYEAKDRDLGRQVALKVVRPGRGTEEEGKVTREAEAIARLTHPNLVTLHDVGRSEGSPYLVFEFMRGKTLQEKLEDGPLPVQEAVHIAVEVARGIAHAHGEGVVHRDLKPSNVFVTDRGLVKILDFGMAHAFGRRRLSGGTPAYMAPEQWEDAPEDERTDVFALGVMLYRMLSGEYPYPENDGRWSEKLTTARVLDIPGAPGLSEIVARMLERTPTKRPRDGAAVLAALVPIEDGLRAKAAAGAPPVKATRRKATVGDLLAELKRRHVFRVMLAYGFFSFAVIQVTEPIMHGLRLRDWVLTAVLAALAVGFPVAVILAWLYDFTSRGVERTPSATAPGRAALSRSRFVLPLTVAIAVLAIVAIGAGGWYAWKHAPARGVDASGRTTVAVADFANDTRDPDLDSLSGLLITSLEQSKKLHVLTRSRMLDHMRASGKGATDRIDEAMARDVGRRADVHALLLASVRKLGDTYVVEMRALDPEKDEYLFTLQETATGKDGIIPLIERLSDRARLALRESSGDLAAADVKIGQGVTSSLEAYRHYFLAQQAMEDHDFERSLAEAKRALEIDPNLALAHAWIGWLATIGVAGAEDAKAHIQAALARAPDLPPKERRFVEALASWSAEGFASLAADFPQDKYFALFAGMTARDPAAKKLYLDRALAIDPTFVWPVYFIAIDLPGAMLPLAQRAAEIRPGVATLFNLGLALGREGRSAEALETARRAQALARPPRAEVDILVTAGLAAQGRLPEAAGELEPWQRPEVAAGNRRMGLLQATRIATLRGRREEALRTFAELDRFSVPGYLKGQAWLYAGMGGDDAVRRKVLLALKDPPATLAATFAEAGLPEQAKALADKLPEGSPERAMWSAVADWKAGRAAEGAAALTGLLEKAKGPDSHPAYLLGRMLADAGRCEDAIVEFDRLPPQFPWPWEQRAPWAVRMPLSLLESARCQVKLGRPAEAQARLDRLLEMWKDADPDLPALADAKALRATLR